MNIIERIKLRAIEGDKTIVLPESMDKRVVEASAIVVREGIANVILIGDVEEIKKHGVDISGVTVINPSTYEYTEKFINMFFDMRKEKGLSLEEARNLILNDYIQFLFSIRLVCQLQPSFFFLSACAQVACFSVNWLAQPHYNKTIFTIVRVIK